MNTIIRQLVCALAVLGCTVPVLRAGVDEPTQGKVALLDGDRILEGDMERVGDQYRVRRSGGETWFGADKVRRLCASLDDAYAWLRSQANLQDPDEHLRLARWCLSHGLRAQALAEARAALELRPKHAETARLVRGLERSLAATGATPTPGAKEEPSADSAPQVSLPYNPAALAPFINKVQPILMNTCASCHATGKGGAFKIIRVYEEGSAVNHRTLQYNLMAVLGQLDHERPEQSPLLKQAVLIHYADHDKPPLRDRQAPAYKALEEWVKLAVAGVPKTSAVTQHAPVKEVAAREPVKQPATDEGNAKTPASDEPTGKPAVAATGTSRFAAPAPPSEEVPPPPTGPVDEFDPLLFNGSKAPQRK